MNSAWSAILNASVLSVPLTAAVWLALRLTPRRVLNAATRYVVWWILLAVILSLAGLFQVSHTVRAGRLDAGSAGVPVLELQPGAPLAPQPRPSPPLRLPIELPEGAWMRWLLALWIFAAAILLLRLLLSHLAICRAAARALDVPPELRERARQWRLPAGAASRVFRLAASATVPAPVATGPFRPAILLPAALLKELHADEMELIAIHEAAHLARRDDWALLLERLLEALLFLHPAVRWIARQIDLEREIACDDLVVETTGRPFDYAECLTRAFSLCGSVPGLLAAAHAARHRSHLSRRVELLLNPSRHTRTRPSASRLSVAAAALIGAAFVLAKTPGPLSFHAKPKELTMKQNAANLPGRKLVLAAAAITAIAAHSAAAQTPSPQTAVPETQVQAPVDHRQLVLLFDPDALTPADQDRAIAAANRLVQTQLKPADQVAIILAAAGAVTVRQDFTADRDLLLKTIQQIAATPATGLSQTLTSAQVARLQTSVQILSSVSGKKMLIYFSSSTTNPAIADQNLLRDTINAAVRANVAFFPIDVRGLIEK